jgi:hypothetical protein
VLNKSQSGLLSARSERNSILEGYFENKKNINNGKQLQGKSKIEDKHTVKIVEFKILKIKHPK